MSKPARAFGLVLGLAMLVAAVDQFVKGLVMGIPMYESHPIIPGILDLVYTKNPAIAFGLLRGLPHWAISMAAVGVLGVFTWLIWPYLQSRAVIVAGTLVYGGAIGNLIDRVMHKSVVDYLFLHAGQQWRWPVFNLADACVVVGVAILMIVIFRAEGTTPESPDTSIVQAMFQHRRHRKRETQTPPGDEPT
ncbi:MAG: signal peptidase II [Armatimonadota bacterium]